MVIYIEIKIADSDGKILHIFENRLDEKDVKPEEPVNNRINKDFENFLGEYLSFGGFALREKLIGKVPLRLDMLKAIEKYEANLYPVSEEDDSVGMEPSFSE